MVNSAHVTQFGERAVDTFYVTDLLGGKVTNRDRLRQIEHALLEAAEPAAVAA
jgi:[protein-PII] uridylyltransferase